MHGLGPEGSSQPARLHVDVLCTRYTHAGVGIYPGLGTGVDVGVGVDVGLGVGVGVD